MWTGYFFMKYCKHCVSFGSWGVQEDELVSAVSKAEANPWNRFRCRRWQLYQRERRVFDSSDMTSSVHLQHPDERWIGLFKTGILHLSSFTKHKTQCLFVSRFSTSRQTLTWVPDSFFSRSVRKTHKHPSPILVPIPNSIQSVGHFMLSLLLANSKLKRKLRMFWAGSCFVYLVCAKWKTCCQF